MRGLSAVLLMLAVLPIARAQFVGSEPLEITSLTADYELGYLASGERFHTDDAGAFASGDIVDAWAGARYIRGPNADRGSTGSSLISFDVSIRTQVCAWISDDVSIGSWVASIGLTDSGRDMGLASDTASGYCGTFAAGTVTLGGNTSDGDDSNPMYFVTLTSAGRAVASGAVNSGEYSFGDSAVTVTEDATYSMTIEVCRTVESDGAVSVDVDDTETGTLTSGTDYTAITDETVNWSDGVLGCQFVSLTVADISADGTIILTLQNAMGGITAGSPTTMTITVDDVTGNALLYSEADDTTSLVEDPGQEVAAQYRRYVCNQSYDGNPIGSDSNNGQSPGAAWQTLTKVNSEIAAGNLNGGPYHVLLCRSATWGDGIDLSGWTTGDDCSAYVSDRIVLGAYGPLSDPRPYANGLIRYEAPTRHVTVRDIEATRIGGASVLGKGAHPPSTSSCFLIFAYNEIHGADSIGLGVMGSVWYSLVLENFVYDVQRNDFITTHSAGGAPNREELGNHHWVLGNYVLGNSGDSTEEGIDPVMTGGDNLDVKREDWKIVRNYLQMKWHSSINPSPGHAPHCINQGHHGVYVWFQYNICGGQLGWGLRVGGSQPPRNAYVAGNIFFNQHGGWLRATCEFRIDDITVEHNLWVIDHGENDLCEWGTTGMVNRYNIYAVTDATSTRTIYQVSSPGSVFDTADNNLFYPNGWDLINNENLSTYQTNYSLELNSAYTNDLCGISYWDESVWFDPREWDDPDFQDHFTPTAGCAWLDGANTPGPRDGSGNLLPAAMPSIDGITGPFAGDPDGCGWGGPPIVDQKLAEYGITPCS